MSLRSVPVCIAASKSCTAELGSLQADCLRAYCFDASPTVLGCRYDFDAATTAAFLMRHGLEKDFKVQWVGSGGPCSGEEHQTRVIGITNWAEHLADLRQRTVRWFSGQATLASPHSTRCTVCSAAPTAAQH